MDCKYNKNWATTLGNKLLAGRCTHSFACADCGDRRGCTVFPDIIIHKRGTDENLLVIEAKIKAAAKQTREDIEKDKDKIEEYLTEDTLRYRCGVFVSFEDAVADAPRELRRCRLGKDRIPHWQTTGGM